MPVENEGRRILSDSKYLRLRRKLVEDVIRYVDREGKHGKELCDIILKIIKKDRYRQMVGSLLDRLTERVGIDREDGRRALAILMEEDIGKEIKTHIGNQMEETGKTKNRRDMEIKEEGEKRGLWSNASSLYLGGKKFLSMDVRNIIKDNKLVDALLLIGILLLAASSFLFQSVYKAMICGLTLTSIEGGSIQVKLGNIVGAIGGILIFFVSLSLVFQYLMLIRHRDQRIREAANEYLKRMD